MPRTRSTVPSYCRQRRKNKADLAFVEIDGVRKYLGEHGSPESRTEYARILAELQADGASPLAKPAGLTVAELVAEFWVYAERYYAQPSRDRTSELEMFRLVSRPLVRLYGDTPAAEFGPKRLKAIRQAMIDDNLSRGYINRQCNRLRRIFAWGVEEELIPATTIHALRVVPGLKRGRTEAREADPVTPVPDHAVDAVLPFLTPTVRAMVAIQRLTGMRPLELVTMKTEAIDVDGRVWVYSPVRHKTAHHGRVRRIYIGPESQRVLQPLMRADLAAFIFDPRQSVAEKRERLREARTTPLSCGNRAGTNVVAEPKKSPSSRYTPASYRRAIHRACDRAGVPRWSPYRLRHAYATRVRREHGVDVAGGLLGHAPGSTITAVYAERAESLAIDVALKIG